MRARARELPPRRIDFVVAAVVLLEGLLEVSFADATTGARLAALGPLAAVALAIPLRRREPLAAVALGAAGIAATGLLADDVYDALQGIFIGWVIVNYFLGIAETRWRLVAGVAIAIGALVTLALIADHEVGEVLTGSAIFVAGPVFGGRMLRARLQLNRALRERAARFEEDRDRQALEAAEGERARIAGELHDVVAHALGAMTVQASAARRLATVDPGRASGAFEAIETTGREALGELRTLLDVLRGDEEADPEFQPQPSLGGLTELIDRAGAAGLPVEIEIEGERPADLQASVDLTGYRIVQEALTEALRLGAATRARVIVRYGEAQLEVEVIDDGERATERHLLGLRERVRLFGGQVSVGAEPGGGHAVRAILPLERVPA
jgi:signal transduction histidine kinase